MTSCSAMARALVTGSTRGIGLAVAQALAGRGHAVAVHGRDAARAQAVAAALPGDGHAGVAADLADAEAVRALVDEAAGVLGGLDVLVNNAGIFEAHPPLATSWQDWRRVWERTLAINLLAAAHASFAALPHLRASAAGRIVNVSSRGAFRGERHTPAYGASKAGLNALGQSLALAVGAEGIAVTTVAPGFVATDMAAEHLEGPRGDEIRGQSPFGRVAEPQEIAAAVVWLATDAPAWLSGTIVDANGASYLRT